MDKKNPILTITGSDPTGGSGVQADLKTISELGGWGMSAITSITVQTTLGIQEFYDVPADIVGGQVDAVMNDFQPSTVKIGMIRREDVLSVVVAAIEKYGPRHVLYAPVVCSTRGDALMSDAAVREIRRCLLPLCTLVVTRRQDADLFGLPLAGDSEGVCLLDDVGTHGLANGFTSAVAVALSRGATLAEAVKGARAYVATQKARLGEPQGRASELYSEFLEAIATHHRTANDVHFYAERLNVSSRYLAQVTRRISGQSPKSIIDEYVVGAIERQLKSSPRTIQQTAYDFGFSSQAHLTKYFKKLRGMSPSQYRKQ